MVEGPAGGGRKAPLILRTAAFCATCKGFDKGILAPFPREPNGWAVCKDGNDEGMENLPPVGKVKASESFPGDKLLM